VLNNLKGITEKSPDILLTCFFFMRNKICYLIVTYVILQCCY